MFSYFLFTDILTSVEYILLDQRNITIPNSKDQDIFTGFITFQPSNGGIETPKTSKGTLFQYGESKSTAPPDYLSLAKYLFHKILS